MRRASVRAWSSSALAALICCSALARATSAAWIASSTFWSRVASARVIGPNTIFHIGHSASPNASSVQMLAPRHELEQRAELALLLGGALDGQRQHGSWSLCLNEQYLNDISRR